MAKPIRNTPILYGKDAKQFLAEIKNLPSSEERKKERFLLVEDMKDFLERMEKKGEMSRLRNGFWKDVKRDFIGFFP